MHRGTLFGIAMLLVFSFSIDADARTRVREINTATATLDSIGISNTCTNGSIAGAESTFTTKVGRLGSVLVTISASWDWSGYSGDHPAALVNATPQSLQDITVLCAPFDTDATVTLTRQRRGVSDPTSGEIVAEVTGGSVFELVVTPDPRVTAAAQDGTCPAIGIPGIDGTINEAIINFEADPTQPDTPRGSISGSRFSGRIARITGTVRTILNSCTGESSSYIATEIERP